LTRGLNGWNSEKSFLKSQNRGAMGYRASLLKKLVQNYERKFSREKMVYQVEASASVNDIWVHLWLVYMADGQTVYVDLIIDDRQNYGKIFMR
jgi:hypothetical protein